MACARKVFPEKVIAHVTEEASKVPCDQPVPKCMLLSESVKRSRLKDTTLVEITVDTNSNSISETGILRGREVLKRHRGTTGTMVLVVRRPGCSFCREQALSVSVLVALMEMNKDFGIIGIIKETGVDDEGILRFRHDYFEYQLYCDKTYAFYHALGDRKVGIQFALNPLVLLDVVCNAYSRLSSKGVKGNMLGEGFTQGGMIFFGSDGEPKFAYEEVTGKDVPIRDLVAVINSMRNESST